MWESATRDQIEERCGKSLQTKQFELIKERCGKALQVELVTESRGTALQESNWGPYRRGVGKRDKRKIEKRCGKAPQESN